MPIGDLPRSVNQALLIASCISHGFLAEDSMTNQSTTERLLGILWWNANNFFHFRPEEVTKRAKSRWPQSREEYREKCDRVDAALQELFSLVGVPKIIALGEITSEAATALRDRLLPTYRVLSLDVTPSKPTPQVAALYAPDDDSVTFNEQLPLAPPRTPLGTRPMAVLDAVIQEHTIRVVICHWQARIDEKGSRRLRNRTADFLSGECYDFIAEREERNHLAIIGDFNEEPFEDSFETLNAHRHRGRSQSKPHRVDSEVKRLHLYNTSWRLMGEQQPHPRAESDGDPYGNCAGTYYWNEKKSWSHFDQLIVSGGLLRTSPPHIDEDQVNIISSPAFLSQGLPVPFSRKKGKFVGLSDHLPIHANVCI